MAIFNSSLILRQMVAAPRVWRGDVDYGKGKGKRITPLENERIQRIRLEKRILSLTGREGKRIKWKPIKKK